MREIELTLVFLGKSYETRKRNVLETPLFKTLKQSIYAFQIVTE
jgi:hypothetical protein